ncbi:histidine-containing phosphotransfer protein 2-like [Triticum dicoccoides]|uniref:histidine-containing phosphotransfer protein 2-like n=1 Tax=Triticum dicoccoides TaxID=85692 RepID=UPI0018904693|nr:histidine-containing phosphotransfer protein 2-like [Triticum dicoccoides]
MAAAALRAQLNAHIAGMYTDGVVDEDMFEELPDEGTAVEVSRLFIYEASKIIDDIVILMSAPTPSIISPSALCLGEEPEVDFDEVEALTQQLMRCTSSVGAQQVNLACMHFGNFYAIQYKHGCLVSLALVRNEFYIVRHELEIMMQLEEQIAACGPNS